MPIQDFWQKWPHCVSWELFRSSCLREALTHVRCWFPRELSIPAFRRKTSAMVPFILTILCEDHNQRRAFISLDCSTERLWRCVCVQNVLSKSPIQCVMRHLLCVPLSHLLPSCVGLAGEENTCECVVSVLPASSKRCAACRLQRHGGVLLGFVLIY